MKKWLLGISIFINVIFILLFAWNWMNSPTYELGRLERDIEIGNFKSDNSIFRLPKGLTVQNVSERGLAAIGQFENERFSIVITSDDANLVNYDLPKDSLNTFGNFYSADIKSTKNDESDELLKVHGNTVVFLRPSEEKFHELDEETGIYEVDSDFGFAIVRTIDSLETNPNFKSISTDVYTGRYIEIEDCKNCPQTIDRDSIYYGLIFTSPNKEIKIIPNVQALDYLEEIEEYFK